MNDDGFIKLPKRPAHPLLMPSAQGSREETAVMMMAYQAFKMLVEPPSGSALELWTMFLREALDEVICDRERKAQMH